MVRILPVVNILNLADSKPSEENNSIRKQNIQAISDKAIEIFYQNLVSGKIKIKSTKDFERVAKLALTLQGEASEIVKTIEEPPAIELDKNDSDVKDLYERLYRKFNEDNSK